MSMHGSTRSVLPGEHTLAIRAIGIMEGRQENSDLERSPDVLVERLDVAVGPHGAPRVLGLHDLHTHLRAWLPAQRVASTPSTSSRGTMNSPAACLGK
jgi:hypothetical protein